MKKVLKKLALLVLFAGGIPTLFIAGQFVYKDVEWLNNLSTFMIWAILIIQIIIMLSFMALSTVVDKLLSKSANEKPTDKEMDEIKLFLMKRTAFDKFISFIHRVSDVVTLIAIAMLGWFVFAAFWLLVVVFAVPLLMNDLREKGGKISAAATRNAVIAVTNSISGTVRDV